MSKDRRRQRSTHGRKAPKGNRPPPSTTGASPWRSPVGGPTYAWTGSPHALPTVGGRGSDAADIDGDDEARAGDAFAEVCADVARAPDAWAAAGWASQLIATMREALAPGDFAPKDERERAEAELTGAVATLIDVAREEATPEALALVAALVEAAPPSPRLAAREAVEQLIAQGVVGPRWVRDVGQAELRGVHQWIEPFGDGVGIILAFRYPSGDNHTLHAYIDHNMGDLLKDLFPAGSLSQIRRLAQTSPEAADLRLVDLDPAEAAGWLRHALWTYDDHTLDHDAHQEPGEATVAETRALLDARLDLLPDDERPSSLRENDDDESLVDDVVRAFVESPDAAAVIERFDTEEVASTAWLIAGHAANYCGGIPDRVSPMTVGGFLVDYLPRKVMDADELVDVAPAVLRAWAQWAGERRGLADRHVRAILDAVDEATTAFTLLMDSPNRGGAMGHAARIMAWATDQGMDLDDTDQESMQASLQEMMTAFNELSFEERGKVLGSDDDPGWDDEWDVDDVDDDDLDDDGFVDFPWSDRGDVGMGSMLPMLPPVDVAAAVAAAEASAVWHDFEELTAFFGTGRPLTAKGNPKVADVRTLVGLLDTGDDLERMQGTYSWTARSLDDTPELAHRLFLARSAGVLAPAGRTGKQLGAAPDWRDRFTNLVDGLCEVVDVALEGGLASGGHPLRDDWIRQDEVLLDYGTPRILALIAGGAGVGAAAPFDDVVDAVAAIWVPPMARANDTLARRFAEGDAERILRRFEHLGVIAWEGWEDVVEYAWMSRRVGGEVTLTPFGVEVARRLLPEFGFVFGDAEELSAVLVEQLASLADLDPDDVVAFVASVAPEEDDLIMQVAQSGHPRAREVLLLIAEDYPDEAVARAARKEAMRLG